MKQFFILLFVIISSVNHLFAQRECYQPYLSLAEKLIKEKNYPSAKQKLADMEKSCELDAAANSKVNELRNKIPVAASTSTAKQAAALPEFVKKGGQYILVNSAGVRQSNLVFDYYDKFIEGLCMVRTGDKYGYINTSGIPVIPIIYDRTAKRFQNDIILVQLNGKTGFVDRTNQTVIPFIYDPYQGYSSFSDGLISLKKNGKYGYINSRGETVIPFIYDEATYFEQGTAVVRLNGKCGLVNRQGNIIMPVTYDYINVSVYEGNRSISCTTGQGIKHGWVDSGGKIIIPCIYDRTTYFSEGLACVVVKDKLGFADKTGKLVIPIMYDTTIYTISTFSEGLAPVFKNDKAGYIDKKNNLVIPYQYSFAEGFSSGTAGVTKDGKRGIINRQGKVVRAFR